MTAIEVSLYGEPDRREFIRWTASLALVLALHLAVALTMLTRREAAEVAGRPPGGSVGRVVSGRRRS